jgi:serine/threonine-protein kinase
VVDPLSRRVLNERFTLLEPIGSGGMGRVYKAVQAPLNRIVAVKVLNPAYANGQDPEFRKRFFLEASLTSRLRHPNTITVIDYGQTPDGIFFIAMEYLEGQTLSQVLTKSGPLTWMRAFHVAQQVCRSLREAHKLGVIHRDLKPANVMLLTEDQELELVKVLDFGLVKSFTPEAQRASNPEVTGGGMFLGSPQYMAPEQARNRADHRSDIYSLGATLYHAMIGRPPFWAKDSIDVIFKHVNEPPPAFQSVRPDIEVPAEVEAVVMRCLEKNPAQRFQSMDELLDGMRRASMALGTSGLFRDVGLSAPGLASTPPPMSTFEIPPTPSAASPSPDTTLALDISVVPPAEPARSQPAPPWYQRDPKTLAGIAAAAIAVLLLAVYGVVRIGSRSPPPGAMAQTSLPPVPGLEPSKVIPVPASKTPVVEARAPSPRSKHVKFIVSSDPPGALVLRHGRSLGVTPLTLEFAGDAHGAATTELLFVLKGYQPLSLIAGGTGEVVLTQKLQPKPTAHGGVASMDRSERVERREAARAEAQRKAQPTADRTRAVEGSDQRGALASTEVKPKTQVVASLTTPPPTNPTRDPEVLPFGEGMGLPEQLSGKEIVYSREAIAAKVEGTMIVKCVITIAGRIEKCRIIKPVPHMEQSVLDALASRVYKPVTFQGKPVAVEYLFNIRLTLPRR